MSVLLKSVRDRVQGLSLFIEFPSVTNGGGNWLLSAGFNSERGVELRMQFSLHVSVTQVFEMIDSNFFASIIVDECAMSESSVMLC